MSVPAPDAKSEPTFLDEWVGLNHACGRNLMPGVRFELTRPFGQRVLNPRVYRSATPARGSVGALL